MTVAALFIRPESIEFEEATLSRDSGCGTHLAALYRALDCSLVDVVRLTDEIEAWLDDEGRFGQPDVRNEITTEMLRAFG